MMKLISWNVNRAGRRVERQVAALMKREADIVAIQEVSPRAVSHYWELMRINYPYFIDSLRRVSKRGKSIERRPSGVVIASRWPLKIMDTDYSVPTAEHKFLSVIARIDSKEIEVHTAHIPPVSQHGQRKVETFKGIYNALAQFSSRPRIICGDFNTPKEEMPNGSIVTWAQRKGKNGELVIDP
jgi:exonuclease III